MRRAWIVLLPLLFAACSTAWPSGSYEANITDAEAGTLATAVADFVENCLPAGYPIAIQPTPDPNDALDRALQISFHRGGIPQSPDGHRLTYVAQPVGDGVMLRVAIDNVIGSQFFAVHGFMVAPAGPMTVAQQ